MINEIDFSIFEKNTRRALEKVEERLITPDSGLFVVFEQTQFEVGSGRSGTKANI